MKQLLLIDANSIIHRAFHALPPFTGPDGRPTGALYGMSAMLLSVFGISGIAGSTRPDYAAALFDRPEPTFRDKKYAAYKAQRPPTADELVAQIIEARKLFEAFGVKVFEKPGFEADDLIATLAEKFRGTKDLQVVVLTGDRDTLQLVEGDKVVVKVFNKGVSDTTIYDEPAVEAKYGLKPNQLIDYKALVGDASDNIKGVPGIGPKTAAELLQRYGTLESVFAALASHDEGIASKLAERLSTHHKEAELSKELVILERNVPLELIAGEAGLSTLVLQGGDIQKESIAAYFKTLGSATLLKRLENGIVSASDEAQRATKKKEKRATQPGLF
jgi:DNA polymerase-1